MELLIQAAEAWPNDTTSLTNAGIMIDRVRTDYAACKDISGTGARNDVQSALLAEYERLTAAGLATINTEVGRERVLWCAAIRSFFVFVCVWVLLWYASIPALSCDSEPPAPPFFFRLLDADSNSRRPVPGAQLRGDPV